MNELWLNFDIKGQFSEVRSVFSLFKMKYLILTILILSGNYATIFGSLEVKHDDELVELIRNEKYVIALFTRQNCEECDNLENELIGLREVLVEELEAWVVKVEDSQMIRLYSSGSQEPVLVFFRHGIPLLYHGSINEEEIFHTFSTNKEPISKELTDETFEHLTQAATGATTGDWFVMFYTSDCIDCNRLQARWEAVGAKIKSRVNLARINRGTTGAATARRFDVFDVPTFIFFRHEKMYLYKSRKYDIDSLTMFAQESFKHLKGVPVPLPKSPFDDLVALIIVYLKDYPWLWQGGLGIFCIIVIEILRRVIISNR